ncbi:MULTISPECIES: SIR2 family protein [Bradyrhizobium]|uniref:SIR2 family protein n=1 Tax=Bradyrhizobium TaxID=374 RepID=UPI00155DE15F|nr:MULTISPECIES: SIR2 family protein [Bradyrhizobium]MDD1522265.1 SIR2 family protein [Bradyrhizobium sp. WBAH30]MDD1546247.1 SIR2 family protein [Bradyrhizobium sp. WBAH41]MDD1559772.1 SIR2 family protein [Bradyrhizobium sp. WBAH23]MDD1567542.1 SIR2 family protein [Bradyrhizobium sp. WBAH33]MDD1593182.1 SIR2 family protein [Bradyrhizobium sp. WBAH42]
MSVKWTNGAGTPQAGPSWSQMVDEAARILGVEDPELLRMRGTDLQILEYFQIKKKNFAPLINWMVRHLDAPASALASSILHQKLAALSECPIFYTTNYDEFLEKSFGLFGRPAKIIASEEDMGSRNPGTEIVKFHGDFNNPDEMVMSEGHYYRRMRLDGPMDLKLRSDLFGRAVLFIGYSFRDINIAYLFQTVNEMFQKLPNSFSGRRAYIIVQNPSDFEYRLFHRRNIEIIPAYGTDRSAAVAEILSDMAA